jgi:Bacteriocin-protection, YdeI or OmpD-Associated/Domain of unknown function (DUF1905)
MSETIRILIQGTGDSAAGVQLPEDLVERLGKGRKPPVKATINGYTWRSTVAVLSGEYWLGVSKENRKGAGVQAGQTVDLTLELDTEERVLEVPADFATALDAEPEARRFFDSLSYSNRRRFTYSIDDAKTPETRQRRIEKSVTQLREGKI